MQRPPSLPHEGLGPNVCPPARGSLNRPALKGPWGGGGLRESKREEPCWDFSSGWGSGRGGAPQRQGSLGAQLACSEAPLHGDTFRIQLLGKQVNSLQGVPTALGVHERAASRHFDWEHRQRERVLRRGAAMARGWGRAADAGRGMRSEVGGARPTPRQAQTTHSGNTTPPHRGHPDLLCHSCRAWGCSHSLSQAAQPSPFHGGGHLFVPSKGQGLCPRGGTFLFSWFESSSPQHSGNPSARPTSSPPSAFPVIVALSHRAYSCHSGGAQIYTP